MSIKLRVAGVFTLALAVAFALGSWLLISQLHGSLLGALDSTVAAQLGPYRSAPSVQAAAATGIPDNSLVQILSRSGQVLRHRGEDTSVPLLSPAQVRAARSGGVTKTVGDEQFRLRAAPVGRTGAVAVLGVSMEEQVSGPLGKQTRALVIGGVVFVVVGAVGAYWLAAAALSPVERMRREVAALPARGSAAGVQVPRTRDELAALAGTMNDLLGRLHHALARQQEFVADASHELRTPLAVLGAELELAGRPGRSRDELVEAVASAEDEVARLTKLTNDLLVLARSDEGKLPVRPEPTRVRDLLERSAARAAFSSAERAACVVRAPRDLVATLDPDRVRQAVDNLIDNALRFAPPGSDITVSGRAHGSTLVIDVADAGPGFPADYLPHAFERFRRPDAGRTRSDGGAGLGLAIVAAVAAAHGGSAWARNGQDGGAVVALELPGAVLSDVGTFRA
ncbi:MAG TPA: ATP-binding protein [Streptosporangiaceae bacterium]|nr:ATP-binding protein [Streptosporangiaceae bacterium]